MLTDKSAVVRYPKRLRIDHPEKMLGSSSRLPALPENLFVQALRLSAVA